MKNSVRKIAALLSIILLVMAGYIFIARPNQLSWGATAEELARPMPGDELDKHPGFLATRAITINAAARDIWPWLVQMGFDRVGFYGYDIIENIGSKYGMHSADTIIPQLQQPAVGDKIPINLVAATKLYAIDSPRYLVWAETIKEARNGGFTWALYPIDGSHSRLVNRIRWSHHWNKPGLLALDLFTEFTDHLAVRKILYGIKLRAEGRQRPSMIADSIEFFIYLAAALTFLTAMVRLLLRPLTKRTYLYCLVSGILWLLIWYSPLLPLFGTAA